MHALALRVGSMGSWHLPWRTLLFLCVFCFVTGAASVIHHGIGALFGMKDSGEGWRNKILGLMRKNNMYTLENSFLCFIEVPHFNGSCLAFFCGFFRFPPFSHFNVINCHLCRVCCLVRIEQMTLTSAQPLSIFFTVVASEKFDVKLFKNASGDCAGLSTVVPRCPVSSHEWAKSTPMVMRCFYPWVGQWCLWKAMKILRTKMSQLDKSSSSSLVLIFCQVACDCLKTMDLMKAGRVN